MATENDYYNEIYNNYTSGNLGSSFICDEDIVPECLADLDKISSNISDQQDVLKDIFPMFESIVDIGDLLNKIDTRITKEAILGYTEYLTKDLISTLDEDISNTLESFQYYNNLRAYNKEPKVSTLNLNGNRSVLNTNQNVCYLPLTIDGKINRVNYYRNNITSAPFTLRTNKMNYLNNSFLINSDPSILNKNNLLLSNANARNIFNLNANKQNSNQNMSLLNVDTTAFELYRYSKANIDKQFNKSGLFKIAMTKKQEAAANATPAKKTTQTKQPTQVAFKQTEPVSQVEVQSPEPVVELEQLYSPKVEKIDPVSKDILATDKSDVKVEKNNAPKIEPITKTETKPDINKIANNISKQNESPIVKGLSTSVNSTKSSIKDLVKSPTKIADKLSDIGKEVKGNIISSVSDIKESIQSINPIKIGKELKSGQISSKNSASFIPPIAGVGAATTTGLGAKIYMDKKQEKATNINKIDDKEKEDIKEEKSIINMEDTKELLSKDEILDAIERD